jgi:hypothetical protein
VDRAQASLLQGLLSPERLAPYVVRCEGDVLAAMRLYAWNIEISSALHGPLGVLEVVLRNALDTQLRRLTGRPDWWSRSPRAVLLGKEATKVAEAQRGFERRSVRPSANDMVAELPFGFWTELLHGRYETTLWRPALRHAFPHRAGTRRALHNDLYHLRILRNRIAHHEPIHHRHLLEDHRKILLVLGDVSPVAAEVVLGTSRVGDVLSRRDDVCAGTAAIRF